MLAYIRIALINNYILLLLHFMRIGTHAEASGIPSLYRKDEKVRDQKSKEVVKYMNLTADACFDFYEFACGNWGKHHALPKENETLTPESIALAAIEVNLLSILEDPVRVEDSINDGKIKRFYKSCLSAERNGGVQQAIFSDIVHNYGGFPAVPGSKWLEQNDAYDWQKIIAQLRNKFGMDILIGIEVEANQANSMQGNSIYLGEPRTTLIPPELCNAQTTKTIDIQHRNYEPIEREVAENLKMWLTLNMNDAKQVAADIVTFEYDLCTGMHNNNATQLYERKTLADFEYQLQYKISFGQIVTTSLETPIIKPVYMKSKEYFEQLIKTIKEHNTTTIANYIMYRAFAMLSLPPAGPQHKRANFCLSVLKRYFPSNLGDMYWHKHIAPNIQTKVDIEDIYNYVRNAMKMSLQRKWIADVTKRTGERKLEETVLELQAYTKGQPLDWFHIDGKNYWKNLMQAMGMIRKQQLERYFSDSSVNDIIEAYDIRLQYRSRINRMDVGGGMQQEPFYHAQYPHAMRYALIGQLIAGELMSVVDDLSWTTPFLGLSTWEHRTAEAYRQRMECFREHISNYLYNKPKTYQNMTRVRELIATSSGVNIAFNAYLLWLNFKNPNNDFMLLSKETLAELNFSNTQLFFIAYAQRHCQAERTNANEQSRPMLSLLERHSLQRYAVNGALQNSVDFALEFGCAPGTQMNPADKCVIY